MDVDGSFKQKFKLIYRFRFVYCHSYDSLRPLFQDTMIEPCYLLYTTYFICSLKVLEEDSLPKIVCQECIQKLENYIEFRETVVSAESMLESYFTSLRFSEDFLKEGKVYVKSTEKERSPLSPQEDPLKLEKSAPITNEQMINNESQTQHQHPVVISNMNTSNIQIISGVQSRVQQYKCAMQVN